MTKRVCREIPETESHGKGVRKLAALVRTERRLLLPALALSTLAAFASLGQPLVVRKILDAVEAGTPLGTTPVMLVLLLAVGTISTVLEYFLLLKAGEGVVYRARRELLGRLLRLPIRYYDHHPTGDLASRVGSDAAQIRALFTEGLAEALGSSVIVIGASIALVNLDWTLYVVAIAITAVTFLIMAKISANMRTDAKELQKSVGILTSRLLRTLGAIRTVRASNATEDEETRILEAAEKAYQRGVGLARRQSLAAPIANITMQAAFLVVLVFGGYRVMGESISVADLITFVLFLSLMLGPVGSIFSAIGSLYRALGSIERVTEVGELEVESSAGMPMAQSISSVFPSIEFDDVWFSYDRQHQTSKDSHVNTYYAEPISGMDTNFVLRGISFRASMGGYTAIVGPSGAGKSTVLALVERFYDAQRGAILLGGADVKGLPMSQLRSLIGYVEQDAPALDGTIRENLTLSVPGKGDKECWRALELVGMRRLVEGFDNGLDAQIGESGALLSGGERQRLALARASLADRPVILLDECTSNLDAISERALVSSIERTAKERTVLVVAHRISSIASARQIVVLDHGSVIGLGTHSNLTKTCPLYRQLVRSQVIDDSVGGMATFAPH